MSPSISIVLGVRQSSNTWPEEDAPAAATQVQAQAHMLATDKTTNTTALVDSATFMDGSLAPESSETAVVKVKKKNRLKLTPKEKNEMSVRIYMFSRLLLEKVFIFIALCYMKMAIDKVISLLPLEFHGSDPVSTCWIVRFHDLVLSCHVDTTS